MTSWFNIEAVTLLFHCSAPPWMSLLRPPSTCSPMNCILVLLGRATGGQADGRVYIGGNIIAFAFVNFILQVQRRVPATEHLPSGGGINLVGWMRLMRSSTPNRTETDRL